MFSPAGYIPMIEFQRRIGSVLLVALDYMVKEIAHFVEVEENRPPYLREAQGSVFLLGDFLTSYCFHSSEIPIFLASSDGRTIRAASAMFVEYREYSRSPYHWPVLRTPGPYFDGMNMHMLAILEKRRIGLAYNYPLLDDGFCIQASKPIYTELAEYIDEERLELARRAATKFDGWAVCFENERAGLLETRIRELLKDFFATQPQTPSKGGRPRKTSAIRAAYFAKFPEGHAIAGLTLKEVIEALHHEVGSRFSTDTLRKAIYPPEANGPAEN